MTNINPIRFGVTGAQYQKPDTNEDLKEKESRGKKYTEEKQLSANEVLNLLAAQNTDMVPVKAKKVVDVSKYVSKEQEQRIADFMKGFEADYDSAFDAASKEFPELSQEAAGQLALAYAESKQ